MRRPVIVLAAALVLVATCCLAAVTTTRTPRLMVGNYELNQRISSLTTSRKPVTRPTDQSHNHEVECGRVPMLEKIYNRSYNGTLNSANDGSSVTGDEESGNFRILHGLDSTYGEWPWIVQVTICPEGSDHSDCQHCTGSLLNSRWLITAGHCVLDLNDMSMYTATLGLYNLITPEADALSLPIDKVVLHPEYNDLNNDISLMRLAREVKFNNVIQPVCLIGQTRNVVARTERLQCFNVGYGLVEGMNRPVSLQKIQIRAMNPGECNSDKLNDIHLRTGSVCIGPPPGKLGSACRGDSGGPDVCYEPRTNQWSLFGTVSFGPSDCDRDSGDKWLTVSVDLSNYRSWILGTIWPSSDASGNKSAS